MHLPGTTATVYDLSHFLEPASSYPSNIDLHSAPGMYILQYTYGDRRGFRLNQSFS